MLGSKDVLVEKLTKGIRRVLGEDTSVDREKAMRVINAIEEYRRRGLSIYVDDIGEEFADLMVSVFEGKSEMLNNYVKEIANLMNMPESQVRESIPYHEYRRKVLGI